MTSPARGSPIPAGPESVAYLQYTSGSTRTPTGVQITHLNLPTNCVQVIHALEGQDGDRGVSWLPFFHDMGLITTLLSTLVGYRFTFMTPAAFVRRPSRWIRELARKEGETGGVFSAAPNFAFEHAALRGLPKDGEPPLDLSNVKAILNGSEPVSAASIRKFNDAFGPTASRRRRSSRPTAWPRPPCSSRTPRWRSRRRSSTSTGRR